MKPFWRAKYLKWEWRKLELRRSLILHVILCVYTYFQFQDHFYVQSQGTAMGSPLPPIICHSLHGAFWRVWHWSPTATTKATVEICGWHLCYMATWQGFTLHLCWPSKWNPIKFIMEMEYDQTIVFLDVLVRRHKGGISTSVFERKPTPIAT